MFAFITANTLNVGLCSHQSRAFSSAHLMPTLDMASTLTNAVWQVWWSWTLKVSSLGLHVTSSGNSIVLKSLHGEHVVIMAIGRTAHPFRQEGTREYSNSGCYRVKILQLTAQQKFKEKVTETLLTIKAIINPDGLMNETFYVHTKFCQLLCLSIFVLQLFLSHFCNISFH